MRGERQAITFANPWKPFGLVIGIVLFGLFFGIILGLNTCSPSGTLAGAKEEEYLVLAASLYSQGESLSAMKVYLNSYAPRDPAAAMIQLADRYDKSGDRKKQQEAKDLRQLGEALRMGREPEPIVTPAASTPGAAATLASPTSAPPPAQPPAQAPAQPPAAAPKPANTSPAPSSAQQPPAPATTPAPVSGQGVARSSTNTGVIMRDQPSTKASLIASLPDGAKVEIVKVVEGEAVDPAESRWYLVKFNDKTGYVYFKLIVGE